MISLCCSVSRYCLYIGCAVMCAFMFGALIELVVIDCERQCAMLFVICVDGGVVPAVDGYVMSRVVVGMCCVAGCDALVLCRVLSVVVCVCVVLL